MAIVGMGTAMPRSNVSISRETGKAFLSLGKDGREGKAFLWISVNADGVCKYECLRMIDKYVQNLAIAASSSCMLTVSECLPVEPTLTS